MCNAMFSCEISRNKNTFPDWQDTMTAPKIQLKSNDDEIFEVDRDVIRLSTTLNTMFQGNVTPVIS